MTTRESRFKHDCEPLTPLGKVGRNKSNKMQQKPKSIGNDGLDETKRVNNEILQEMQEVYERNLKDPSPENLNRAIIGLQRGLQKMQQKAERIGIDLEDPVNILDNRADEKRKIIEDIKVATFMLDNLRQQLTTT